MTSQLPFPFPPLSLLTNLAEIALNRALETDTFTRDKLAVLAGKTVALHLDGPDIRLYLFPGKQGLDILTAAEEDIEQIDATITTMPLTLARTFFERDSRWFENPDWMITGDIELARELIDTLLALEIDWEEMIAQRLGDVPARFIGRLVEQGAGGGNVVRGRLRDFLQAELQVLPNTQEIDEFVENVTGLAQRVESLAERISQLRNAR